MKLTLPVRLPWSKNKVPDAQAGFFMGSNWFAMAHCTGLRAQQPRLLKCHVEDVTRPEQLPQTLNEVAKLLKMQRLPWNIALEWEKYFLFPKDAPQLPKEEIAAAMAWIIRNHLEFPVEEAVVDCFDIPEQGRMAKQKKVYVVAAQKHDVQSQARLLHEAKLSLQAVDIPELGLNNIASLLPENKEGVAILYLPPAQQPACLQISCQNELYLTRRIDGYFSSDDSVDGVDSICETAYRSLEYYQSNFGQNQVAALYLAALPKVEQIVMPQLVSQLNVRVKPFKLETVLPIDTPMEPASLHASLLAIGMALRPVGELL
ncbi:MAG: hypothetical protein H7839_03545 [Magnetococcus sp. YQC-5]